MAWGLEKADAAAGLVCRLFEIVDRAVEGGHLASARELADEYRRDSRYLTNDERVDALIKWESSKNFTSGFATGLGGLVTLPVSIPAALGASWLIQARMSAAIADLYGFDPSDDRVKSFVRMAMVGDAGKSAVEKVAVAAGTRLTAVGIQQIPARVLIEINKRVGFRLLTKAGQTGVVQLGKAVPIAGGVIGGSMDALACVLVGKTAKRVFSGGAQSHLAKKGETSKHMASQIETTLVGSGENVAVLPEFSGTL